MPTKHHQSIFRNWHALGAAGDVEGLTELYTPDAVFESPLVRAIDDDAPTGIVRGTNELRDFFAEASRRRPVDVLRGYRTGHWLADGPFLVWEYPRETPNGDQLDLVEVMQLDGNRIAQHRVYWGWRGVDLLLGRPWA